MYLKRRLGKTLRRALGQFPSVLITGPRQSGKTTFLREEFGDRFVYRSFDDPLTREFARRDPNGFLEQAGEGPMILDEIQYVPEMLSYLKVRIDEARREMGRWLLTGSQQFSLMREVSESLAGRIALLELHPFSSLELEAGHFSLDALIWNGAYPEPHLYPEKSDLWMSSYIQTYLERDMRLFYNVRDLRRFETFLGLCAGRHSQIFNKAAVARECGVTEPTIKSWGDVLAASYIVFYLYPYFRNYGKRLIKSPKLYFLDAGLVSTLTRQPNGEAALAGAMGGALFEGLMISEAVKVFTMHGKRPDLYFWRSRDGLEVDLILQIGNRFHPVEIKSTATPSLRHTEPLNRFKRLAGGDASEEGLVVCRVPRMTPLPHHNTALPWREFPKWVDKKLSCLPAR